MLAFRTNSITSNIASPFESAKKLPPDASISLRLHLGKYFVSIPRVKRMASHVACIITSYIRIDKLHCVCVDAIIDTQSHKKITMRLRSR